MHTTATGMDLPAAYVMVDSLAQRRNTNVCLRQCWRRANGFYVAQKEKSGNSMQKTKSPQDAGHCSANTGEARCEKKGLKRTRIRPLGLLHNLKLDPCCLHAEEDAALQLKADGLLSRFEKKSRVCMHFKKASPSWLSQERTAAAHATRLVPCGDQSACFERGSGA